MYDDVASLSVGCPNSLERDSILVIDRQGKGIGARRRGHARIHGLHGERVITSAADLDTIAGAVDLEVAATLENGVVREIAIVAADAQVAERVALDDEVRLDHLVPVVRIRVDPAPDVDHLPLRFPILVEPGIEAKIPVAEGVGIDDPTAAGSKLAVVKLEGKRTSCIGSSVVQVRHRPVQVAYEPGDHAIGRL